MSKSQEYTRTLHRLRNWDAFLLRESGLPGPRGNLELAQVVADEGNRELFERYLCYNEERAPTNSPYEFLAFCGVLGLGKLVAHGESGELERLRAFASDSRWRIREAVAMALQRWGDSDMDGLLETMEEWSKGNWLEQRAAAAALCEPRLLGKQAQVRRVLKVLNSITASILKAPDREGADFQALRKGLGYCWSVAIAASPEAGKRAIAKWLTSKDKDIRWVVRENLKKDRLKRMDPSWVRAAQAQLE